ncbi:tripartite tricarboxylate transporter substrate binding protein [Pseudohoeflea coraliihabitans]|uniref:Tripartite tricarboxylate transporter substrate binding protein n=1 Tax=Pseudohoeflea coraliihabitans TaxID=2860393 RepID=A0ABS6WMT5_9HYPH|nr:tripartite tricarboxylate transporter substrate binding protein [Pseudohoeflea sp. DP4N28-3]MBW3097195.1 tripartite tricarboxylate transporter substrate binding protein [Pseudohoeflea sp. DP4N28-3]
MNNFLLSAVGAVVAVTAATTTPAVSADFPESAITIQLPFGPGGGTDMLTRAFDMFSEEVFGDNFIITYKPGAGGAVGTTALARAGNDGYTIGMGSLPHMFLQPAAGAGQYSLDDFDFIALVASEPQLMVTPEGSEFATYEELKAAAKSDPGALTLGIPSPLSETWLAYNVINDVEDLGFTVVTYQGGAALNAALLGKQIDAAVTNIGPVYGSIDKLNVLGVTAQERVSFLPNVPTFKELGVDAVTSVERVFMAPEGVPEERLQILRDGFKKIWHKEGFQDRAAEMRFGMKWMDGTEVRPYLEERKQHALEIYEKTGS